MLVANDNPARQTWHDKMASSVVVGTKASDTPTR
jgi:hypothetical protein